LWGIAGTQKPLEQGKETLIANSSTSKLGSVGNAARALIWLTLVAMAQMAYGQTKADLSLSPVALRASETGSARGPVTIVAFLDFQCPYCARSTAVLRDIVKTYPDQVRVIVKNAPLSIHPGSARLHEAAMAAAAQGKFWEMYDVLYARQTQMLSDAELMSIAKSLGMNVDQFREDMADHRYQPLVERDRMEANALGVEVTPTFFVNGKKLEGFTSTPRMKQVVDAELRRISPASVKAASVADLRVGNIDLSSAPVRGTAGASVQIVEFSDMQCPYCARQVEVLRQLVNAYPGKVAWYFKSYPLSFHPDSPLAHRALVAAGKQGKFWEMHDLIFANQSSIKRNDLIRFAAQLNLNVAEFNAELEDSKIQAMIENDQVEGERLGVSGTPAMFINGRPITGVHTYSELQQIIEDELKIGPQGPVANSPPAQLVSLDLSRGPANAPVTITWFSDLSSPLSADADRVLRALQKTYPEQVKLVFKNRPVAVYTLAEQVHQAAMFAASQNKFWEMEQRLVNLKRRPTRDDLVHVAKEIGLNATELVTALDKGTYRETVSHDILEARQLDVRGSPVFFVNSIRMDGVQPLAKMQDVVEAELKRKQEAETLRAGTSISKAETSLPTPVKKLKASENR
jgi:protein-disulfide isomerase